MSSGDAKRELAMKLGADEYINSSKEDAAKALVARGGAKVIMLTAPSPKAIETLLPALGVNGTLLILALMPENASINVCECANLALIQRIGDG